MADGLSLLGAAGKQQHENSLRTTDHAPKAAEERDRTAAVSPCKACHGLEVAILIPNRLESSRPPLAA
jgi:hypothetical protein